MDTELLDLCNVCNGTALEPLDPGCNIARCRSCGYVFDNPRPTAEELAAFYSRPGKYDSWLHELDARERLWKRRLSKLQSTKKPGTLLDVGTGIGQFLAVARSSYSEVCGTEVSATAIGIAKDRYDLDVFQGTIEDLATQGRVFDNVALFHVLEHVTDPKAVLQSCHALLSAEGVLVIAVPSEVASLRAAKRRLFGAGGRSGKLGLPRITLDGSLDEIHLSHFTPAVLRRLVTATGFSVLKSTLDPYYVRKGPGPTKADIYYYFCLGVSKIFRVNIYDTILMVARRLPRGML
jgi:ubiquinone/menaquinone biosynthesis C-methylase UbiE